MWHACWLCIRLNQVGGHVSEGVCVSAEESAVLHIAPFMEAAQKVISSVDRLYDVNMPPSSSWM
jgi:hypothetical protein